MPATRRNARFPKHRLKTLLFLALTVPVLLVGAAGDASAAGGPLILMGIDAEDFYLEAGQHGPIQNYVDVIDSLLGNTSNGGNGILVIGGGKASGDDVTEFWDDIGTGTGETITYANGAAISSQSFAGFQILAVVSGAPGTPSGGLTDAENDLLVNRKQDVVQFVNSGGGLFGLSQAALTQPYGYLDDVGDFTFEFPPQFDDIAPTPEGTAIGVTDALDICCWHDEFITFPSYLDILAFNTDVGHEQHPAAIGGLTVVIGGAEGRTTGGGRIDDGVRVTHGFELHCDVADPPNNLEVNWGGNKFHLLTLDSADCSDDRSIDPKNPNAPFDTFEGSGTGRCNGSPAEIDFLLSDGGEPQMDRAEFEISGSCTLDVGSQLNSGNHQAHKT